MDEPPLTVCPECNGHVHRVFQPVGIIFKGSGFYVTDNRAKSSTSAPGPKKTDDSETRSKTNGKEESDE